MPDTIRTTGTVNLEWQPQPTLLDTECKVARALPGLLVFRHQRGDAVVVIAETTENRADAPASIDYTLNIDGVDIKVVGHKRLRRASFVVKGAPVVTRPNLLTPNTLLWPNDWLDVPTLSLGKIIPAGGGAADSGGAPEHGIYPSWSNDALVSIAQGRVHGHLPTALRDPDTLLPIRDTNITMGFNPVGIKGVDVNTLGNKLDTAHNWSPLPAYLAARGTVLERFYFEQMEFIAIHAILSDNPGQLWNKQVRAQGRSLRNVVDWCEVCEAETKQAPVWEQDMLLKALAYYRELRPNFWDIVRGLRVGKTSNRRCIAPFEWALLLYGIYRLSEWDGGPKPNILHNALEWFAAVCPNGTTYEITMSEPGGVYMPLWTVEKIIDEEQAAFAAKPTRYDTYRKEDYVLNWLRYQLGMPLTRPLDDPVYLKLLDSRNDAGFMLPWVKKPKYTVKGETFTDVGLAREAAKEIIGHELDLWFGAAEFRGEVLIQKG